MSTQPSRRSRNQKSLSKKRSAPATTKNAPPQPGAGDICVLRITLLGSDPPIWRRFAVPADIRLDRLHRIIQIVMGWTDSHLHQFVVHHEVPRRSPRARPAYECNYVHPRPPKGIGDIWKEHGDRYTDECRLNDLFERDGDLVTYEYDMGDNWEHNLEVEKVIPAASPDAPVIPKSRRQLPAVCLEGKLACPPDDCGGIWGYYELLEAIQDPKHEMHKDMIEWIGDRFDAEAFDPSEVNRQLRRPWPTTVG